MITKSLSGWLALGALWGTALSGAVALGADAGEKVAELKKLREKVSTLHTVATTTTRSGAGSRESTIETWEKMVDGKQKARRVTTSKTTPSSEDKKGMAPSTMVKDGVNAWRELDLGERSIVFRSKSETRTEYDAIQPLLEKGVGKIRDGESLLDQLCVLLEIAEKADSTHVIGSYWISQRYGVVLKSIVESAEGTMTETKVTQLKVDEEMPESLFAYRPPANAQIIDEKSVGAKKSD